MALLPPQYLNSVVSIGERVKGEFTAFATGFLVGFLTGAKNEKGEDLYHSFLVTNRHVFERRSDVVLRFNLTEEGSKMYDLSLTDKGQTIWTMHPNEKVDLAVVMINSTILREDGISFTVTLERSMAFTKKIRDLGVAQGDAIFVLGFPLGIAGVGQNYAIVKGGVIARLDEEIINRENAFLIDSNAFPGNSGGPVYLRPELVSVQGTKPVKKSYLLGVVSKYIPFEDTAVSRLTGRPRVVFVENSGLALVVPMDFVKEATDHLLRIVEGKAKEETVAK